MTRPTSSVQLIQEPPSLRGNRCQCPACRLYFTSVREFDRHRVGQYAPKNSRRCRSVLELQQLGWSTNKNGFWHQPRPERAPAGLAAASNTPQYPRYGRAQMTSNKRLLRQKGRRISGQFIGVPYSMIDSPNWMQCSSTAIKLLFDIARQYNGLNNGDLSAAPKIMKPRGWRPATVTAALKELRHYGLLIQTRQGGLHRCSLYAISWKPTDDGKGKHDYPKSTVAPNDWKVAQERYIRPRRKKTPVREE